MNLIKSSWKLLYIITFGLAIITSIESIAQSHHDGFFTNADEFFQKHVLKGRVDYQAIKKKPDQLNDLLDHLNQYGTGEVSSNMEKALLINAYNLFVIKGIVDNYPAKSPLKVPGFFDNKVFRLGGEKISLNQLEKGILIKQTGDARLHFVLVCAAIGCPKIAEFAYQPGNLDHSLEQQTKLALEDPDFIRVDNQGQKAELSQIFNWYKGDFTKGKQSVIDFINKYRTEPIPDSYKIGYYEYDWNLNLQEKS